MTFGPGGLTQTISIPLNGDTLAETDETFFLNLANPVNAALSDVQAIGTIQDDDSLVIDDVMLTEGDSGATVASFTAAAVTFALVTR